ncbi:MAG: hypothetical protein WCE64_05475, partial [Bacteroidales bacterium]
PWILDFKAAGFELKININKGNSVRPSKFKFGLYEEKLCTKISLGGKGVKKLKPAFFTLYRLLRPLITGAEF